MESKDSEAVTCLYELMRGAGSGETKGRKAISRKVKGEVWKTKVTLLCR